MSREDGAGGILVVTVHRRPADALGEAIIDGLSAALDAVEQRNARVVVIASAVPGFFAAGADQEVASHAAALELENSGQVLLTRCDDVPEALAAFRERRPPHFTGR